MKNVQNHHRLKPPKLGFTLRKRYNLINVNVSLHEKKKQFLKVLFIGRKCRRFQIIYRVHFHAALVLGFQFYLALCKLYDFEL